VVDVRVGEDDRVQPIRGKLLRRERQMRVDVGCLLAMALEEAAVQSTRSAPRIRCGGSTR